MNKALPAIALLLLLSNIKATTIYQESFEDTLIPNGQFTTTINAGKWFLSGDNKLAVVAKDNNQFNTLSHGKQFASISQETTLVSATPIASIQKGKYTFRFAVGRPKSGPDAGVFKASIGYGTGKNDFVPIASHSIHPQIEIHPKGSWKDFEVECCINEKSPSIGKGLLLKIEHHPFTNNSIQGYLDNFVVSHQEVAPEISFYNWPTEPNQALLSEHYSVKITHNGKTETLKVIQNNSQDRNSPSDFNPAVVSNVLPVILKNRTFSWASFACNFAAPVVVEIEKKTGAGADAVDIWPSPHAIPFTKSKDGKKITFTLTEPKYLSINFKSPDNVKTASGVVTHMLMLFADPMEKEKMDRNAENVYVFNHKTKQSDLDAARNIFIPAGYYNLSTILGNRKMFLNHGTNIYFEGGAYVMGLIVERPGTGTLLPLKIYGRGALGASIYPKDKEDGALIKLANKNDANPNILEGIHTFDSSHHGITPGMAALFNRIKFWGWHYNHDGFRPWGRCIVQHCFLRPVDDAFYISPNPLFVTDTTIWQGGNGAVATYGWGGYDGTKFTTYDGKHFRMSDSYIIHPEWENIGNNNGIIMTQTPGDRQYTDVHFMNIVVDGNITAITNLKLGSNSYIKDASGKSTSTPIPFIAMPGNINNLTFRNLTINGEILRWNWDRSVSTPRRSLIEGKKVRVKIGNNPEVEGIYMMKDITFKNLIINKTLIGEYNKHEYFEIDPETTSNIRFE